MLKFAMEARITAQLQHPNIVPVYELAQMEDLPVLTHCSRGGVHYLGWRDPETNALMKPWDKNSVTDKYTDPRHYVQIAARFPNRNPVADHLHIEVELEQGPDARTQSLGIVHHAFGEQ